MNSKTIVAIHTPVGYTNEVTFYNIVTQETTMKSILCIVEADKINKILESCYTTYGPQIRIDNLLYVDDIVGEGKPMVIENTVKSIKQLEERKKFTFSNIKSDMIKIGNKDRGY